MIGDPSLREVVSANPLGAVAAADLAFAGRSLGGVALFGLRREQSRRQQGERPRAVLVLRALVLALDDDAARQVRDADRRVGLVDVLAARARRTIGVDAQVRGIHRDVVDLVEFGQHRHRTRGGVDPSLCLGGGHSLHAMRARLETQPRVGALADDAADHLAVAAVLARILGDEFDGPAVALGVARVHAQKVAREDRRLVAAGTRTDLEEDVALIVRVLRHEQFAQCGFVGGDCAFEAARFLIAESAQLGIRVGGELACRGELALEREVCAVARRERFEARVLHRQLAKLPRASGRVRVGEQPADLFGAFERAIEALADRVFHGGAEFSGIAAPSAIVSAMRWMTAAAAVLLAACATPPEAPSAIDAGAATLVAETALARGDCRTASDEYAQAARARAAPVATIERALTVALDCQQFEVAGRIAAVLRERAPSDAAAARLAGVVALREGRNADGAEAFRDAARLSGDAPEKVLADLIEASADAGNDYGTYRALRAAVDTQALDAASLVRLGTLAFGSYVYRDARALAEAAIARDPASADAQRLLAQVLAGSDDADGALRAAGAARRIDPKGQVFTVAETLIQLDRIEEARRELEQLLQDDDAGPQAERRLALLAFREGDIAEAAGRFSTRLRTGDDPAEALYYLGALAERHGDKQAALGMYKRLVDAGVGMIARQRAAAVLMQLGKRDDAFAMLDAEGADKPQAAVEIAITKAALLRDADAAPDALPVLDAALARFPGHPDLAYQRALTLDSAGRKSEAVAAFEALYRTRHGDPVLMNALGYTLADHGKDLARAHRLIDDALALTPDNPAILDSQGWVRFRRGEGEQALVPLARAYRLSRDTEIAAHWGEVLWSLGREGEARAVWARAVARDPGSRLLRATITRFIPASPQ